MHRPKIAIVNSSSFGKHFPQHLDQLNEVADVIRVQVPTDVSADALVQELRGVHGIVASVTPRFPKRVLEQLKDLVLLARHGIGCDNVELEAATELGIMVSKVEGIVEREAVAEHAVTLLLAVGRMAPQGFDSVRASRWEDRAKYLGIELRNKKVGIIGIGNIGSRVAEILGRGFQSDVMATDPYVTEDEIRARGARPVSLSELLSSSDIVSFHCPVTAESKRMLNRNAFSLMKKGAILINTCRGELLDEDALIECLESGQLRAYGTDVVEGEPIGGDHRLLAAPHVLVLPHLGGYTTESLFGMGQTMVDDVMNVFVHKKLPGVLANPEVEAKGHRKWA
ncbi:MAG: NAD(P)-dependent oxidoreductase [Bdellovibrionota bacterium]